CRPGSTSFPPPMLISPGCGCWTTRYGRTFPAARAGGGMPGSSAPRRSARSSIPPPTFSRSAGPAESTPGWCGSGATALAPRLGLIAVLAQYRRRGVARALLGQAFAVLAGRGATSVTGEVDDTNVASVSLLTGLGARRYGGNVELIRRQPGR